MDECARFCLPDGIEKCLVVIVVVLGSPPECDGPSRREKLYIASGTCSTRCCRTASDYCILHTSTTKKCRKYSKFILSVAGIARFRRVVVTSLHREVIQTLRGRTTFAGYQSTFLKKKDRSHDQPSY